MPTYLPTHGVTLITHFLPTKGVTLMTHFMPTNRVILIMLCLPMNGAKLIHDLLLTYMWVTQITHYTLPTYLLMDYTNNTLPTYEWDHTDDTLPTYLPTFLSYLQIGLH